MSEKLYGRAGELVLLSITLVLAASVVQLSGQSRHTSLDNHHRPEHPLDIRHKIDGPVDYILKSNESTWIDEGVRGTKIPAYYVETNSKGLREESFNRSPPENTTRILVIGDSYTYGWGVNRSERFTERFESSLNGNYSRRFQVINAGIPGTGMKDFYLYLRERGLDYRPDYVVVPFQKSDMFSTEDVQELEMKTRNMAAENATYEKIMRKIRSMKKKRYGNTSLKNSSLPREMVELASIARENEIKPVFYITEPLPKPDRKFMGDWARNNNIPVIYPPGKLYGTPLSKYVVSSRDLHYNSQGHKILYQKLYSAFTRKHLGNQKGLEAKIGSDRYPFYIGKTQFGHTKIQKNRLSVAQDADKMDYWESPTFRIRPEKLVVEAKIPHESSGKVALRSSVNPDFHKNGSYYTSGNLEWNLTEGRNTFRLNENQKQRLTEHVRVHFSLENRKSGKPPVIEHYYLAGKRYPGKHIVSYSY